MRILSDLKKEVSENTPQIADKIKNRAKSLGIFPENKSESVKTEKGMSRRKRFSVWAFAAVAAIILTIAIPLSINFVKDSGITVNADYEVVIDVNPAIKLIVNESDTVIKQEGLNEDGVKFLYATNYVGKSINVATEEIIAEMEKLGLLSSGRIVRVSAYSGEKRTILEKKQNDVAGIIEKFVRSGDVTTVFLSDDELDKIEEYYESHAISKSEREAAEELKKRVKEEANKKITAINYIVRGVGDVEEDGFYSFTPEMEKAVSDFCDRYNYESPFDRDKVKGEDVKEFIDDLIDMREELEECLEEIDDEDDEFGEVIADLLEIVKEDIFNAD